ncbi:MAG TPA: hypothetical protein VKB51_13365 [bacterium]|nr:hypothetical protein [bacterium]
MGARLLAAALTTVLLLCATPLAAAPRSGPGFGVGIGRGWLGTPALSDVGHSVTLGVDMQLALGEHVTLNPLAQWTHFDAGAQPVQGIETRATWDVAGAGMQARLWLRDAYLGVHGMRYNLRVSISQLGSTTSSAEPGFGSGMSVGYEPPMGILLALQYESFRTDNFKLRTLTVLVGLRL